MLEWVLAIYIIMPDNTRHSRRVAAEKPQPTLLACNKLKLKPSNREIVMEYERFSHGVAQLVCVGIPKKTEV